MDLIFVIGANPASNHPRFIHQLKACRDRGGDVIVINPAQEPGLVRFAVPKSARSMLQGGTGIASDYLQPRIGTDIALLKGLAKAVLETRPPTTAFIADHTIGFDGIRSRHRCNELGRKSTRVLWRCPRRHRARCTPLCRGQDTQYLPGAWA